MSAQDRAVVQHMVEALEQATPHLPVHTDWHFEAIEAGKQLLSQADEPSYWLGYGLQAHTEKPFDGATPLYTRPQPSKPDYAWPTVQDYEKSVGCEVNDTFKTAWALSRMTNDLFEQLGGSEE